MSVALLSIPEPAVSAHSVDHRLARTNICHPERGGKTLCLLSVSRAKDLEYMILPGTPAPVKNRLVILAGRMVTDLSGWPRDPSHPLGCQRRGSTPPRAIPCRRLLQLVQQE